MADRVSKKHEMIRTIGENSHPPHLKPMGSIKMFIVVYPLMMAKYVAQADIRFLLILGSGTCFFTNFSYNSIYFYSDVLSASNA